MKAPVYVTILAVVLCAGCATSSLETRKAERRAAYDSLSPEFQGLVNQGQIKEGMDTNAVFIAWGKPTEIQQTGASGGAEIRWVYWRSWTRQHPYWSIEPGHRGQYYTAEYRPTTTSSKYQAAWVVFKNDRVVRWTRFPPPSN